MFHFTHLKHLTKINWIISPYHSLEKERHLGASFLEHDFEFLIFMIFMLGCFPRMWVSHARTESIIVDWFLLKKLDSLLELNFYVVFFYVDGEVLAVKLSRKIADGFFIAVKKSANTSSLFESHIENEYFFF